MKLKEDVTVKRKQKETEIKNAKVIEFKEKIERKSKLIMDMNLR